MRQVYLDNNATTAVSPAVRKAMDKVLRSHHGNPSSKYRDGAEAALVLETSRRTVAESIGASPDEIVFTGSASEANNQLLLSCVHNAPPGRHVIVSSPIEHPSVLKTLEYLASNGTVVRYCPVDELGHVKLDDLTSLVDDATLLVCIMLANNETGVIQDVKRIADIAHRRGAWLMSDCVQALGKIPVDVKELDVDFASFSAHKIHGPKGVGALYARSGLALSAFIHGGHQEHGLRAGTEGVHNIAGFAEACKHVPGSLAAMAHTRQMRDALASGIRQMMPSAHFNSDLDAQWTLPNTLSVTLPGFDAEETIAFLDFNGVSVSAGSACNATIKEPSAVLKAIGLSDEACGQTLRMTLSRHTNSADIAYVLKVLRRYLTQTEPPVTRLAASRLSRDFVLDDNVLIVDIRRPLDRKALKGLPRSLETSSPELRAKYALLPRDKHIVVVCQVGFDSAFAAYFLRSKGYRRVSFVMGGVVGWKLAQPDLYQEYAGRDAMPLSRLDQPSAR